MSTLENTKAWFVEAIKTISENSQRVQMAVHFEEVAEMLEELKSHNGTTMGLILDAHKAMHQLSEHLKQTPSTDIYASDRKALLDSLCDQLVTATGVGHMMGFDIIGALGEVNNSNFSKFVDGKAVFNEQGKITKGPLYSKPVLDGYVGNDPTI